MQRRRGEAAAARFLFHVVKYYLVSVKHTAGEQCTFGLGGLWWYLLALCVVILNQVLQEVHSFLGLDLIYFDQVLQKEERSGVRSGVKIQGMLKGYNGFNDA